MAHSGSIALTLGLFLAGCGARTSLEDDPPVGALEHAIADDGGTDVGRPDDGGTDAGRRDAGAPPPERCDCRDVQNPTEPAYNCVHGAQWIAWEYTPSCTFSVGSIELHTNGGQVALLDDADGQPGATLASAALDGAGGDAARWRGATFAAAVPVEGGRHYWIAERVSVCSIALTGVGYRYFGGDSLAGPWDGPFMGHAFTSRVSGTCR